MPATVVTNDEFLNLSASVTALETRIADAELCKAEVTDRLTELELDVATNRDDANLKIDAVEARVSTLEGTVDPTDPTPVDPPDPDPGTTPAGFPAEPAGFDLYDPSTWETTINDWTAPTASARAGGVVIPEQDNVGLAPLASSLQVAYDPTLFSSPGDAQDSAWARSQAVIDYATAQGWTFEDDLVVKNANEVHVNKVIRYCTIKAGGARFVNCAFLWSGSRGVDTRQIPSGQFAEFIDCDFGPYPGVKGSDEGVSPSTLDTAIGFSKYYAIRCRFWGSKDGTKANGNAAFLHCWVGNLVKSQGSHSDCIQSTGGNNVGIFGCGLWGPHQTSVSAIKMTAESSNLNGVYIAGCRVYGGSQTVFLTEKNYTLSNAFCSHNSFVRDSAAHAAFKTDGASSTRTGNLWDDDDSAVT